MAIIVFLSLILIVQTAGMIIHRLNTLLGALQELDDLQEAAQTTAVKRHDDEALLAAGESWTLECFFEKFIWKIAREAFAARGMVDTSRYENAHGADGFTRISRDTKNVLYKLNRAKQAQRMHGEELAQ